ncbi:unnamed protein product [Boreogadus saida]
MHTDARFETHFYSVDTLCDWDQQELSGAKNDEEREKKENENVHDALQRPIKGETPLDVEPPDKPTDPEPIVPDGHRGPEGRRKERFGQQAPQPLAPPARAPEAPRVPLMRKPSTPVSHNHTPSHPHPYLPTTLPYCSLPSYSRCDVREIKPLPGLGYGTVGRVPAGGYPEHRVPPAHTPTPRDPNRPPRQADVISEGDHR